MDQQHQQSHPQSPASSQTAPVQLSSSASESPSTSHCPDTPISTHVSTASATTTSTVGSSTRQNGHPTSTGGEVSTTMTSSQTSHTTTQGSYRAQHLNASTEQWQCGSHPSSTSVLAASSPQPSPSSSQHEDSHANPEGLSVSGQQHGYLPATTTSPQLLVPTKSSPMTQHNSGTMTTVQQHDVSLSGQITAMAISPHTQLPPNSSHSTTTGSQSSYTASPSAMRMAQQHGYVPSPSASQISQQHGHPPPPLSTYQSSSQPPSVSTQRVTSQQSYAASPDASTVQHHGHHSTPPSSTTSHVRPSFPPQAQPPPPNLTYSGASQQRAPRTNPGTTATTFRQHGYAPPPTASQFTTPIPSRVPPNSFQHSTASYSAPRASAGQHHAIPSYPSSHPYIPSQHANPPSMQLTGAGYSSLSSNFSSQAVHGSLASSTGSSYQPMGSSPYPFPAAVYGQQQHMVSRIPSTHRPTNSGKIFILYCKDPQLHQTFSDDVLDLADVLNHCGGFTCMVDHYVNVPPDNWNIWTQQRIEESHYVILVCSPTLAQVLREPANYILEMEKGKYYVSAVVNFIQPQKVIPVYLNHYVPQVYLDWVPMQLHTSTVYSLNIAELRSILIVSEDSPRHVLDEKLRVALSEERFRNITKLVNHLRGETATSPPVPPEHPIPIPPIGPGGIPQFPSYHLTSPTRQGLHENIPSTVFEKIAERMPRDWFTLGVKLGVESTRLQKLRTKHSFNHVPAALEMFGLWQQTKGRLATRKALKDVLVKMEYGRLAFELFPDVKN